MAIIAMLVPILLSATAQGTFFGIMAVGVYLTYRVLDFADLTVDGSFALGGAVAAVFIVNGQPFLAIIIAPLAGMVSGLITGLLHTKLMIPGILAGILTQIALYSINLRIMGRPNTSLLKETTMFTFLESVFAPLKDIPYFSYILNIFIGAILCTLIIFLLYWFFGTEIGNIIRATGSNEYMVRALGGDTDKTKILGLFISNGFVALSGAIVAQFQGFADVSMGTGTIVIGLASVIIGEVFFGRDRSFGVRLLSAVVGAIIYRLIIALVIQFGLNPNDQRLFTAILVAIFLAITTLRKKKVPAKTAVTQEEV